MELRELSFVLLTLLFGTQGATATGSEDLSETSPADGPARRPSFAVPEGVHTVRKGGMVKLPCSIRNLDPSVGTGWSKDINTALYSDYHKITYDERMSITESDDDSDNSEGKYDLTIEKVEPFDSGNYECNIFSDPAMVLRHKLVVETPPYASITPDGETVTAKSGESVILSCYTGGNPPPNITWTREDKRPVMSGKRSVVGQRLTFDKTEAHHSGKYVCTAANGVGEPAVASINLEVKNGTENKTAPEVLNKEATYVPVIMGNEVELKCQFDADPVNDVYWSQNGFRIDTLEKAHKYQEYRRKVEGHPHRHETVLKIKSVEHSDIGDILCRVVNDLASDSHTLHLSERPGPSNFVTGTKSDATSVHLIWFVQSPSQVDGFELKYRKHNTHKWEHVHIPGKDVVPLPEDSTKYQKSYRLQNLDPESKYEINVRATNHRGHGSWALKDLQVTTGVDDGTQENVKPTVEVKSTNSCSIVRLNWVFLLSSLAILLKLGLGQL